MPILNSWMEVVPCVKIQKKEKDDQYSRTVHYWKEGRLGIGYQTFLDAIEVIESCDMSENEKDVEKEKVFEARKLAIGSFQVFPTLGF